MDRPNRLANSNDDNAVKGSARDFTLRRGDHVYRLRADEGSEQRLLEEIRRIAQPVRSARRAA